LKFNVVPPLISVSAVNVLTAVMAPGFASLKIKFQLTDMLTKVFVVKASRHYFSLK
jgi:hypothetical protein